VVRRRLFGITSSHVSPAFDARVVAWRLPPPAHHRQQSLIEPRSRYVRSAARYRSYQGIADSTCSATTLRDRRNEWIQLGIFSHLKQIVLETYDRIVGLILSDIAVDGCVTKAPGGGECAGRSPVDRGKQGMKRSSMVDGYGISLGRVLAGANRHDSPLLAPTLDKLDGVGPLPENITVHLDAGYDSAKTRDELARREMTGAIAHKGDKAPIQAGQR
jgi:hypothetical protein